MKTWMKISLGVFAGITMIALTAALLLPTHSVAAAAIERRGGPNGQPGNGSGIGNGNGNGNGSGTPLQNPPTTPLTAAEAQGLQDAILEEYGALNLYQGVMDTLGAGLPFTQIARSEQQHVNALLRQAQIYGVEAPANPGLAQPVSFDSLAEACQAGVQAEIADAALYDTLKAVTTHTSLLQVYDNLQSASLNQHLPAFEACQ